MQDTWKFILWNWIPGCINWFFIFNNLLSFCIKWYKFLEVFDNFVNYYNLKLLIIMGIKTKLSQH